MPHAPPQQLTYAAPQTYAAPAPVAVPRMYTTAAVPIHSVQRQKSYAEMLAFGIAPQVHVLTKPAPTKPAPKVVTDAEPVPTEKQRPKDLTAAEVQAWTGESMKWEVQRGQD